MKNYTTIIKNINISEHKKMLKYLFDNDHKNHKATTIFNPINSEEMIQKQNDLYKQYLEFEKTKGQGRKLKR